VETLEAVKLFLSVKKMAFVIAADEDSVARAIGQRLSSTGQPTTARQYLEKIIQVPVRVPALNREQTEEYLSLLMLQDLPSINEAVEKIKSTRPAAAGTIIKRLGSWLPADRQPDVELAERLAPILHHQTLGNPRRIKRFLNAFWLRMSLSTTRGISLDAAALAKLMLVELYYPDLFGQLLSWLAAGTVDDKVRDIEERKGDFSEQAFEWGQLKPALAGEDLAKYLLLAASLRGETIEEAALPPELREIADQLKSLSAATRRTAYTQSSSLGPSERAILARYLCQSLRQLQTPEHQKILAEAISILANTSQVAATAAEELMQMNRGKIAAALPVALLAHNKPAELVSIVKGWADDEEVPAIARKAAREALGETG
jgi:hypothetical protein